MFLRESRRSSKAQHIYPASRSHKKAPPASALWSQQVTIHSCLSFTISRLIFFCMELKLSSQYLICSLLCARVCLCVSPVCVYVNKHGNCGPHLDRKQMQHLPDHFGPGPVNAVLQQVVQSCIDCAYQPKILLSALQTHAGGGEVVRGNA